MQQIIILGNIGKVEEKEHNEKFILEVTVACNEKTKDKTFTTWYKCISWSDKKHGIKPYLKTGDMILVTGMPAANAYVNNEGKAIATLEIKFPKFDFAGGKKHDSANTTAEQVNNDNKNVTGEDNSLMSNEETNDLPF